jgi:hypothetical protein
MGSLAVSLTAMPPRAAKPPEEQFLTAVFELRPTRRKAGALERVRDAAETVFWESLGRAEASARGAESLPKPERRRILQEIGAAARRAAISAGLNEPIAQGLGRDAEAAAGATIEARAKGRVAGWPTRPEPRRVAPLPERLGALAESCTLLAEQEARDALNQKDWTPRARPLTLARERDCRIHRDAEGRLAVALNLLRASDTRSREARISAGSDACTGEVLPAQRRKTLLMIPLACSKWHEDRFLSGKATLKSALVFPRDGRWWLQAQFALPVRARPVSGQILGIDRGVVNPAALALVDAAGAVLAIPGRQGAAISAAVSARVAQQRRRQQDGDDGFRRKLGRAIGATRSAGETRARTRIGRHIDMGLHLLANEVVALARGAGARVALEKLDGLKRSMRMARPKGARRGGWGTVLRKAQLAKLETLLTYKLTLAGLPPPREVIAAGTSVTCAACGTRDPKSRPAQDRFLCTACGFAAHADDNAAVLVARRGAMEIKKGDTLDALHKNMVARLRTRGDGGLGPLASGQRIVAARAAGPGPYAPPAREGTGLDPELGQNVSQSGAENGREAVVAERGAPLSRPPDSPNSPTGSEPCATSGCGDRRDGG